MPLLMVPPADVADNGDKVANVPEDKRVGRQKKGTPAFTQLLQHLQRENNAAR